MKKLLMIFESETKQIKPLVDGLKKADIAYEIACIDDYAIKGDNLYYKGKVLTELPDAVLFRCGLGGEFALAKWFEVRGVLAINNSEGIKNTSDKLAMFNILSKKNIKIPATIINRHGETYKEVSSKLGTEFIIKDRFGQQGREVFLVKNEKEFDAAISKLNNERVIFQQYIKESAGKDLRTYIVGDLVVGGLLRESKTDFRSNISLGGTGSRYDLSLAQKNNSLKIAKALKGDIVSVDYLLKDNELYFCEANDNACIAKYEELGYHIGDTIINYIKSRMIKHSKKLTNFTKTKPKNGLIIVSR